MFSWILLRGKSNTADIIQKKLPSAALLPSFCVLCGASGEDLSRLFFYCSFVAQGWSSLLYQFKVDWVFDLKAKDNIVHLLCRPIHSSSMVLLLWINAVKNFLSESWFERNSGFSKERTDLA